jgi:hypothetical protein
MVPLKFPPGVVRNGTQYSVKGRWYDSNLIRWVNNYMRPVGGWVEVTDQATPTEPFRSIFTWTDNDGASWIVVGSADKLYAITEDWGTVHDITPATLSFNPGGIVGYGSEAYGDGRYGVSRPDSVTINEDDQWVFDNWGENLLALHTGDGRLFQWDPNTPATVAAQVTNAPIGAEWMCVTDERHCMLFGVDSNHATYDDPRGIIWCDRENLTDWDTTSDTNTAGDLRLQTNGTIVSATMVPQGVLVITTDDAHLVYFTGGAFVYGRRNIGKACGCMSGKSLVPIPNGAVWVGFSNFWKYEGSVERLPCDLLDFFYRDGDLSRPINVHAGLNEEFREVWFFRPSLSSDVPDEYVFWSFRDENWWGKGTLTRHAMTQHGANEKPFMTNDNTVYQHEFGWLDNGVSRGNSVFAESGDLELGNGERTMHAREFYQDIDEPHPHDHLPYTVSFKIKQSAMGNVVTKGPYSLNQTIGATTVRFNARQVALLIEQDEDEYWSMGTPRLRLIPGGIGRR